MDSRIRLAVRFRLLLIIAVSFVLHPTPRGTAQKLLAPDAPTDTPRVVAIKAISIAAPDLHYVPIGPSYKPGGSIKIGDSDAVAAYVRTGIQWAFGAHSPDPSWSPDGSRFAYYDGVCVTVRTADGTVERTLRPSREPNFEGCRSPRWSHDSNSIVTSHSFIGDGILFNIKRQSALPLRLRDSGLWSLSFDPEDRFLMGRLSQTGTVLLPVDDPSQAYAVLSDRDSTMDGYFPAFSPDGKYVARVLGEAWAKTGRLEILKVEHLTPSGKIVDPWDKEHSYPTVVGKRIALVTTKGPVMELAWDPAGKSLAIVVTPRWYEAYDNYVYPLGDLRIVNIASGKVTSTGTYGRNPEWSPDGRFIAFDRPDSGIWLLRLRDLRSWRFFPHGVEPRWSPHGNRMLILDPVRGEGEVLTLSE